MKILLHICCAPCSTEVIDRLKGEGYDVTGFFYNPNIQPENEYEKRLEDARKYSVQAGIELIECEYESSEWTNRTLDYKSEPEGGTRCKICYEIRLRQTAETAEAGSFDFFTTTLSISPYKNAEILNKIGNEIAGSMRKTKYMEADFKKKNGYNKSICKSRESGLYRQDYCGCIYSKTAHEKKKEQKRKK